MLSTNVKAEKSELQGFVSGDKAGSKGDKSDTFSNILKGLAFKSKGEGSEEELLSLTTSETHDLQFLSSSLTSGLTTKDIKELIFKAKSFLQDQIGQKANLKELKETMPKTLDGLLNLAKKIGINVEKISFEELNVKNFADKLSTSQKNLQTDRSAASSVSQESTVETSSKEPTTQSLFNMKKVESQQTQEGALFRSIGLNSEALASEKNKVVKKDANLKDANSTEALQANKLTNDEDSKPLRSLDSLKFLLKSDLDGAIKEEKVASTTVINNNSSFKEVASDLLGDQTNSDIGATKNASLKEELNNKLNEAKTMVNSFSSRLKEAVEDYKPPFTRLSMKLNPEKFGEVDLTIVQRGNNVHINVNANNSAINILAQNSNDLRAQLANNGLSDATLNFGQNQQQQQQNQQQRQQEILEQYAKYDDSDDLDTIYDSLEIVLPRYI